MTKIVDPNLIQIEIDALRVTQPIGDLFVARVEYDILIKISYFDVRRVLRDQRIGLSEARDRGGGQR